jgi:hypothetical protein
MPKFLSVKQSDLHERFICFDHICSLDITRADSARDPNVAVSFVGGSYLELSGEEAKQFLEAFNKHAQSGFLP